MQGAIMKVELLFMDDCPNYLEIKGLLEDALNGLKITTPIEMVRVRTEEEAKELQFMGSPTIRLDGKDIEEEEDFQNAGRYGLFFRRYKSPNPRGIPSRAQILRPVNVWFNEWKNKDNQE